MNEESVIPDDNQLTIEQALINLQCDDLGLRTYAAWWLGRFRVKIPAAVTLLIEALFDQADRTDVGGYPLRRNAARALGKLDDRRAVPALIQSLDCTDFYVREASAQSLEMLGDRTCIPKLIELIQPQQLEPDPTSPDPDLRHPFDAFIEALGTLGAVEAIPDILPFVEHPIPKVSYAAARALYQLEPNPELATYYGDRLVAALGNEDLQLRRTVLSDLGAIGYLGAAEAIANTMAENSLKLIALKGVLEKQITLAIPPDLTNGAKRVMAIMDDLL